MTPTNPPKRGTTTNAGKRFPAQKRLRRFIPNPDAFPGFRLTGRDVEIIKLLERYRFLTGDMIRALAPGSADAEGASSEQGITRRLGALFHTLHLARMRPDMRVRLLAEHELRPPIVYALRTKGKQALEDRGEEDISWSPDWNLRKQPHLVHELMISNFRVTLELALALPEPSHLEMSWWENEEDLRDSVTVEGGKYHPRHKRTFPVSPDGYAVVRAHGERVNLFLEADNNNQEQSVIARKARGWWHFTAPPPMLRGKPDLSRAAPYWQRYESPRRLVLFVTTTEQRMQNMMHTVAAIEEFEGRGLKLFWFTTEDSFSVKDPSSILRPIWRVLTNVRHTGRSVTYDIERMALFT